MSSEAVIVVSRIRKEISEIDKIKDSALRRWQKALSDEDYLGSVAFDLQSFYQGVERVFEIIAKSVDRSIPSGERWHKMLLEQMSKEFSKIRPAVIAEDTKNALDQFRMFRHLAHNIYSFNLVPEKIKGLIDDISRVVDLVCHDFSNFSDFLDQSSSYEEE